MDDWLYFGFLILSAVVGALVGVYGQSLRDWYSRAKLSINVAIVDGQLHLQIINNGKRSTRELTVSLNNIWTVGDKIQQNVFFHNPNPPQVAPHDSWIHLIGSIVQDRLNLVCCTKWDGQVDHAFIDPAVLPINIIASVGAQDIESVVRVYKIKKDSVEELPITKEELKDIGSKSKLIEILSKN